jgi:hypothetical protein
MKQVILILASTFLFGCQSIRVVKKHTAVSDNIPNKILNTATLEFKNRPLFNLKANSHRDPNLKGDLVRQEYFINLNF